ncbi:MAG TPA: [protein-PII] uridylyltransferase [Candidatus Binataceae bacterium]|nr:[protein-PII] uridylyltransferase [Candidatus Binataceae bacterium]
MSDLSSEIAAEIGGTTENLPDQDWLASEFESGRSLGQTSREYLHRVREVLKRRHLAGASGTAIVTELTAATDHLLRALYQWADAERGRRYPRLNQCVAIVARGGYGRGELNPYSDIDLLFLHDWKPGPYVEIVAETILHALWDAGMVVGSAMRNVKECVRMAGNDLKEKTAVIDSRFLAGNVQIYAELEKARDKDVLERNQQKFFKAKLDESRERHSHYGDSVYLLEPQIKEGEGGLRDLHTALWLAKVKYRAHSLEDLVQKAVITENELKEVKRARDFLWRVRNSLHFLSGRHFDQLTFEYQEAIAPIMGFTGEGDITASGALMRAYYQQASTIHMFAEGLIARVIEPGPTRYFRRGFSRQIRPGVVIQGKLLAVAQTDFFERDPLNLVTIFADCQAHEVELAGATYQLARDNLFRIDDAFRRDQRSGKALMAILSGHKRVAETLESMHRAGVLGALIPEFGNLYARVLHDLYHVYTVDRHCLAAVRELERLCAGEYRETAPVLTEVAHEMDRLPLIFLALLLHDIGKGHGHDHHERGAVLAAEVAGRLGLDSEQVDLVAFLVRQHLLMSQISQKRDLEDEGMVAEFARTAGSIDRLKALYLLTFADMRAVAPKVYNNWRDSLLSDLYMKALRVLEQGDREAVHPARRLELVKNGLRAQLAAAGNPPDAIELFLQRMPDRYFLTAPESDLAFHFDLMRRLGDDPLSCHHRHFPEREFSEFFVLSHDQRGLFSKIAGVLTANHLNILSARITTAADGTVLDVFRVSHARGMALEEERWERVDRDLRAVLTGRQPVEELVERAHRSGIAKRPFIQRVPTQVTVDNRASEQFTVVDVFTQDRLGLLFEITHTLFELGLQIHLARISTNADQALDVFYVSDLEDAKITDIARLRELRETLVAKLDVKPAERAVS